MIDGGLEGSDTTMLTREERGDDQTKDEERKQRKEKAGTAILMKALLEIKCVCRMPGSVCRKLVWVSTTLLTALLELLAPIPLK